MIAIWLLRIVKSIKYFERKKNKKAEATEMDREREENTFRLNHPTASILCGHGVTNPHPLSNAVLSLVPLESIDRLNNIF